MSVILRTSDEPALDRASFQEVQRASVAYAEYKHYRAELSDPEDDEGPDNDDAWLFEDLHVFLRVLTKARDKEQLVELIFEVSFVSSAIIFGEVVTDGVLCCAGKHIGAVEGYRHHLLRTAR